MRETAAPSAVSATLTTRDRGCRCPRRCRDRSGQGFSAPGSRGSRHAACRDRRHRFEHVALRQHERDGLAGEQLLAAFTMASNTGCVSVTEPLMTRRISAVAVCRSSASVVSLNRRTFSIAITAWSANVCSRSISVAANGRDLGARSAAITPTLRLAEQRHVEHRCGSRTALADRDVRSIRESMQRQHVLDVHGPCAPAPRARRSRSPGAAAALA